MTDVPPSGSAAGSGDEPETETTPPVAPPPAYGAYPPPAPGGMYGAPGIVSDDEIAEAIAAQTAMYTGPITIPVVNSDPVFRPDPAEVQADVPPPPVPEAQPAPDAVSAPPAPDAVSAPPAPDAASAPPAPVAEQVVSPFAPEPAPVPGPTPDVLDEQELSRRIEEDVAAGATLDAILLLENELRRRQGISPAAAADAPPAESGPVLPVTDSAGPAFDASSAAPAASEPPVAPPFVAPPLVPPAPVFAPEQAVVDEQAFEVDAAADGTVDAPAVAESPVADAPVTGAPVFEAPAPVTDAPAAEPSPFVPPSPFAPPAAAEGIPGWTPAPAPEAEGASFTGIAPDLSVSAGTGADVPTDAPPAVDADLPVPEVPTPEATFPAEGGVVAEPGEAAWLAAPPPSFTPPPLVEPEEPPAEAFDPAKLTPPPVADAPPVWGAPVVGADPMQLAPPTDMSMLPPPAADTIHQGTPSPFEPGGAFPPPPPPTGAPVGFDALLAAPPADAETEGIDDTDRADLAAPPTDSTGAAMFAPAPVATAAVGMEPGDVDVAEVDDDIRDPGPGELEHSATEPTPLERRDGRAARLFWLWFAANSSIVMVAVGATLFSGGMSLRQALVAVVAGVGLSALPLGLGTLAGKWSGQPTMVVSRAVFGLSGNILPAVLAVLSRALWGGVLLWLLGSTVASVLAATAPSERNAAIYPLAGLAIGGILAGLVAAMGYGLLYRVQRVLAILSTILIVALVVLTSSHVDLAHALQTDDGPWTLAIGGAVIVFSVVGLAWAQSSSDLARYQRAGGSGAANMLWGSFGVIVPTLLILSWGAILAASDVRIAEGLATAPVATLTGLVPSWFALPLAAAAGFGLFSGAVVAMYSGGFAVLAAGLRAPRVVATIVAALLTALVGAGLLLSGGDVRDLATDVLTTLAVPVAAWVGIFACEMMIRSRRFHAPSLLAPGGVYPAVRWANFLGLLVISGIGFGFTTAQLAGLDWQGYLFAAFGVPATDPLAAGDIGVLVALGLGLLLPLLTGIPAIRRQERPIEDSAPVVAPVVPTTDPPVGNALVD